VDAIRQGDNTTQVTADKYFGRIEMPPAATVVSVQVNFNHDAATHTGVGVLYIQGSNHETPTDAAAGTNEWETLDVVFTRAVTSGAGQATCNMAYFGYRWIRTFYDFTSGSGAVEVRTMIKVA
jgi:hypothetical protein